MSQPSPPPSAALIPTPSDQGTGAPMISATWVDRARWEGYVASGAWREETIGAAFAAVAAERPDQVAVVDGSTQLDYAELDELVGALAGWLVERGVAPGQAVGFQLPNWWEAVVVHLATLRVGGVVLPLHMIYRQHELRFVLDQARPAIVFTPDEFRGVPYRANAREAVADLERPPRLVTVRGVLDGFADLLADRVTPPAASRGEPSDIALLMYTSGTTSAPKGVLHSHQTLQRAADDLVALFDLGPDDVALVSSPITHVAGLLRMHVPLCLGGTAVLMDRWDPGEALDLILAHGCTYTGGAVPFVAGLVLAARDRGAPAASLPLRCGPVGGTDVPPDTVALCEEVLGVPFSRVYGLSEGITATGSGPRDDFDTRSGTDGRPLPGMEVRIVAPDGTDVEAGEVGEIALRGPANFLGYVDASLNDGTFLPGGWMCTGDLGRFDGRGRLLVDGRKKDIIIRGGENISVREVEDLLAGHPAVAQVVVVSMPSERLGEQGCAYVVPVPGADLTLERLTDFLRGRQIAPQKLPEHLVVVPDGLPVNATGKVERVVLRADIRARLAGEPALVVAGSSEGVGSRG